MHIKWPFITRQEHDAKVAEFESRLLDLERHFVTKRDEKGNATETLADIPVQNRTRNKTKQGPLKGRSWHQVQRYLEETDGGRVKK